MSTISNDLLTIISGHLAGILVGMLYTQGPLKMILDLPIKAISFLNRPQLRQNRNWGSGVSGISGNYYNVNQDMTDVDYDEAVRRSLEIVPQQELLNNESIPPPVDSEELRQRRLARFTDS